MNNPYKAPDAELLIESHYATSDVQLADRFDRLLANLADGLIDAVIVLSALFLLGFFDEQLPSFMELNPIIFGVGVVFLSFFLFLLTHGYFIYTRAQTLGKYFLDIQVVDKLNKPISGNRYLFIRMIPFYVTRFIPLVGPLLWLIDVLLIFRKSHQCLHDNIAGSNVISIAKAEPKPPIEASEQTPLVLQQSDEQPGAFDVDYSHYSFAELISARHSIHSDAFPERAKRLDLEINKRKRQKNVNEYS